MGKELPGEESMRKQPPLKSKKMLGGLKGG